MKKILLFGASIGGQNFLKNHASDYEFLAIVDNDINKQGKIFHGLEVISPSQIPQYEYNQIIVTSMYVESISKQLKEIGIPKDKIEFASKNSMKINELPFENPVIVDKANRLIVEISKTLQNITHYYTFGTLLGIVRDGGLIPWDDDIDIAIFAFDIQKVQEKLLLDIDKFEELFDIKLYLRNYTNGQTASLTLDCFEKGNKLFGVNFDCMYVEGNMVKQELNDTPFKFFNGHDEISFQETKIPVPKSYKSYLDYTYGNWGAVKKNTSFKNNTISFKEPLYSCTIENLYESK